MRKILTVFLCAVFLFGGVACSGNATVTDLPETEPLCGNTQTTVYIGEDKYTFMGENSVTLTALLKNLDYKKENVCDCLPEYFVDTEFCTGYGIHLTEGYARYEGKEAELTSEQIKAVNDIIKWVKTQEPDGKLKITKGDIYSDFGDVNIKIKEINLDVQNQSIVVDWVNKTVYNVIYGENYAIERYENEKWINCSIDEEGSYFNAIGICLAPNATQQEIYSFDGVFDLSKEGKYRIITNCFVYKNGLEAKGEKCNLLAEFTLSK